MPFLAFQELTFLHFHRLAIQRLEIAKNDLQHRIAKEVAFFFIKPFNGGSKKLLLLLTELTIYCRLEEMQFYKLAWREGSKLCMRGG